MQVYERIPHDTTGGNLTISYDNSAIIYSGSWVESSPTGFMETSTTDDNLIVIFYGDEAEVTLQKNPAGGDFEIWINGNLNSSPVIDMRIWFNHLEPFCESRARPYFTYEYYE